MAYRSPFTGTQVTDAVKFMSHPQIGVILTFDSSASFPDLTDNLSHLSGKEKAYYRDKTDEQGNPVHPEFYKRVVYVDSSDNIMYRWRYMSQEEWLDSHDDLTEYPADGYAFFPISGAGGGDLYWNDL